MPLAFARPAVVELLEPRRLLTQTVIEGVLPISLDQPRVNVFFRRGPTDAPITVSGTFNAQAFLDTGSTGLLLSRETVEALGLNKATYQGSPVTFYDVGVAGFEAFDVSEVLYLATAPQWDGVDIDNPATYSSVYTNTFGPVQTQIFQSYAEFYPLDILGMPAMEGKVVVMDARPIFNPLYMNTFVYDPGTPFDPDHEFSDPGIPTVSHHIELSYAAMSRFTMTEPEGATPPTMTYNPFIGPDPVQRMDDPTFDDGTPPVTFSFGGQTSTGSFLLDTGAASSFMSQARAAEVGVYYQEGTYGSDTPVLVDGNGNVIPNQFMLTIGGVGGSINAAGFFLDSMVLQTTEGDDLVFQGAPMLVLDITVEDPITLQTLTLDGDIGMNYFVPSAAADLGDIHGGAFDWITFDEPNGILGVNIAQFSLYAPEITGISTDSGNADGITTDRTLLISGTADPSQIISVYLDGDLLGTTTSNAFGNWTYDNTAMSLADGTYELTAQASDGLGGFSPFSQAFTVTVDNAAPTVTSFTINDGNVQRSMINSITIVFDEAVSLVGALSLKTRSGADVAGVSLSAAGSADQRTYVVTFSGAVSAGSLNDGMYVLVVNAAGVHDLAGNAQAANATTSFHRLFGDSDGDRDLDNADLLAFKRAFNKPLNYVWWLDYNDDDLINSLDYQQLKSRLRVFAR